MEKNKMQIMDDKLIRNNHLLNHFWHLMMMLMKKKYKEKQKQLIL